MDLYLDPRLLTLALVAALILMVALVLLCLWLRPHLARFGDAAPAPCGLHGMCQSQATCADHYCPGHPRNEPRQAAEPHNVVRLNVVRLYTRSDTGQRVDTRLPYIPQPQRER